MCVFTGAVRQAALPPTAARLFLSTARPILVPIASVPPPVQCALLNLGCVLAGVVKSLAAGREEDLPALVLHCAPIYLPVAAIAAGYDARIVPVCALSHALTSLILVCTGKRVITH